MKKNFLRAIVTIGVLFFLCVGFLSETLFAQNKPVKISNLLDVPVVAEFIVKLNDGRNLSTTQTISAKSDETIDINVKGFYTITISLTDNDGYRGKTVLNDSSIPYYSKDSKCEGTIIYVRNKLLIGPQDFRYAETMETPTVRLF